MSTINTGPEDQEVLVLFAKRVAENLGEKGSFPSILSTFPVEGKKMNSEKFIAKNFLGYSFFHSSFTVDYELLGKKFKLFIIEGGDRDDCKSMIEKYLQTIRIEAPEKTCRKNVTLSQTLIMEKSKFNGRGTTSGVYLILMKHLSAQKT